MNIFKPHAEVFLSLINDYTQKQAAMYQNPHTSQHQYPLHRLSQSNLYFFTHTATLRDHFDTLFVINLLACLNLGGFDDQTVF
jgi:hypothetical protein